MNLRIRQATAGPRVAGIGRRGLLLFALVLMSALPHTVLSQEHTISPQALELLKASTDFLAQQKQFSLETRSSIDFVLDSGQKIQFDHTARVSVERPDRMRAERTGDLVDQILYYDGETLTLHNPVENLYMAVPAPDTLEETLDFARAELGMVAPAGDLLFANAFDVLTEEVISGFVVGKSVVDGARCNHLAFRAPHVDWQIWIEDGDRPLMRKLVITTLDMLNAPQFTVIATHWNLDPEFAPETFSFRPPEGARQIERQSSEPAKSRTE